MPDLTDLLAEADRIRRRSGRTAEVVGLLVDALRARSCPHVVTADEGTAHCDLADAEVRRLASLLAEAMDARDELEAIERGDFG